MQSKAKMEIVENSYFMLFYWFQFLTGSHIFKVGLEVSTQLELASSV